MQQQWTLSWSDCDAQQKVGFIRQPALTNSVVGPRRSSKELPKAKIAPKSNHGHCLVVHCPSDPLQISEFQRNHYIWEVGSANRWDAPKTATPAASSGQQKGPNFSPQHHMSHNQCFKSWMNWAMKFCLIHYIHLTSRQLTTTSSSIWQLSAGKTLPQLAGGQKILSKSSLKPKAQIFTL